MGRIVNPHSIRTSMNEIKSNVDEYSSHYKKVKSIIARYSFGSPKLKGMTAKAVVNQLYCYETLMDMFIIIAENISKACDAMIMNVGDEYLNEDNINRAIDAQEGIKARCVKRIADYRHKQMQLAPYPIISSYCGFQINRNNSIKTMAEITIAIMNRKLEKIDEIERKTKELFLAEKAAMTKIGSYISKLKRSGESGFRFQELPVWAADMEKQLFDRYNKEMLTKGRLNESFVERFSDLTIAEMTPAEFKAYQEYVKFLILKAKPDDLNKVIKHAYRKTINDVMELKDSAYELAATMDVATRVYCMTSAELVDSSILERCTMMNTALTIDYIYETGKISLKDGRYNYEYSKNRRVEHNHSKPMEFRESYTTIKVSTMISSTTDKVGAVKNEYLKNLMRKDGGDYAVVICKAAVEIGVNVACPGIPVGVQAAYGLADLGIEIVDMPSKNEDFGIKSDGIGTMAQKLKLRASIANPGTKTGELIYKMYPTNETTDRLVFYNKVFKYYKMEPIKMTDVYYNPESVNGQLNALNDKMGPKTPYTYKGEKYKDLDSLESAYDNKRAKE